MRELCGIHAFVNFLTKSVCAGWSGAEICLMNVQPVCFHDVSSISSKAKQKK